MRDDQELVNILEAVKAATPPEPPIPPPEKRSILYMPPSWRRGSQLARNGRLAKLHWLARLLSDSTDTPDWLARMAMDAAIPFDHEQELDDPANDLPVLERAVEAMGLDVDCLTEPRAASH